MCRVDDKGERVVQRLLFHDDKMRCLFFSKFFSSLDEKKNLWKKVETLKNSKKKVPTFFFPHFFIIRQLDK